MNTAVIGTSWSYDNGSDNRFSYVFYRFCRSKERVSDALSSKCWDGVYWAGMIRQGGIRSTEENLGMPERTSIKNGQGV